MKSVCEQCALRPAVAKARCDLCYGYRRRHGTERPTKLDERKRRVVLECIQESEDEHAARVDAVFAALVFRTNRVRVVEQHRRSKLAETRPMGADTASTSDGVMPGL